MFARLAAQWHSLDFVVHAIGFSDKNELKGRYVDNTTRENFSRTMLISCFSFTEIVQRAMALMPNGGSLLTLTFGGSTRVMPNYNVMGIAKAALEASVRYLAADCGPRGIRVNAISAGPIRTLAGAGIADARLMFNFQRAHAPLRRSVTIEDVGGSALYLLSDLASGVTGEVHFVDAGYNIISMPRPEVLKLEETIRDEAAESGCREYCGSCRDDLQPKSKIGTQNNSVGQIKPVKPISLRNRHSRGLAFLGSDRGLSSRDVYPKPFRCHWHQCRLKPHDFSRRSPRHAYKIHVYP